MLRVQITRRADGGGVLRCVRADGSVTWQKQGRHASFFALHDLTHLAVESTLGFERGFFGLIAEGWDIEDTTGKGARGSLPDEARQVERIVGTFDIERASGTLLTLEEFNEYSRMHGGEAAPQLRQEEILRVRARRAELFSKWGEVASGEALELQFGRKS
jgi:hypothetical protein